MLTEMATAVDWRWIPSAAVARAVSEYAPAGTLSHVKENGTVDPVPISVPFA